MLHKPAIVENDIGFVRNSFRDTLDTSMFFRTRKHEEAIVKIGIGINDRHAIMLLSGKSGTGKTLVSQVVLRSVDMDVVEPVFVYAYPGMAKGALLRSILAELEVPDIGRYTQTCLAQLQQTALDLHAKGKRLVIVIDEAHFLKADALHLLRTLSNLETEHEKLVSVLLIAEQFLLRRLRSQSYSSLRGRITFGVELMPLSEEETEQYVKFRLLKSGVSAKAFPATIYPVLHRESGGIPREINRLMYNGFVEAGVDGSNNFSPDLILRVKEKMVYAYA